VATGISSINFGSGLEVILDSSGTDCDNAITVYQNPLVNIGSTGFTCDTPVGTDPASFEVQTFREIIFGSGLDVTTGTECVARVDAAPYVFINNTQGGIFETPFRNINFLEPLSADITAGDSCSVDVSLTGALFNVGATAGSCDTLFGESGNLDCSPVTTGMCLKFGQGLTISDYPTTGAGDTDDIVIDAIPQIRVINANSGSPIGSTGVGTYAAIEFGDGFSITSGQVATGTGAAYSDCVIKVDATSSELQVGYDGTTCSTQTDPFDCTGITGCLTFGEGILIDGPRESGTSGDLTFESLSISVVPMVGITNRPNSTGDFPFETGIPFANPVPSGECGSVSCLSFNDCFEITVPTGSSDNCTLDIDLNGI
jgi:hypothetical protein